VRGSVRLESWEWRNEAMTYLFCHSERSEESTWTLAAGDGFVSPTGFFAALRMIIF
jgi:hypothetical protein